MAGRPSSRMYATILRAPEDLRRLHAEGWDAARAAAGVLADAMRVYTIGTGTSYHAALHAAFHLRLAGCDAIASSSEDFVCFPPPMDRHDAALVFAHTGTTSRSARAIARAREAGGRVVVISATGARPGEADLTIRTVAAEESAAYTSSHTASLFVAGQIAQAVSIAAASPAAPGQEEFGRMPDVVEEILTREDEARAAAAYAIPRRTFCAGAGADAPLALEASLKARETAYITIDALPTEQFLHGPMVTAGPGDFALLAATGAAGRPRTRDLLTVLDALGVRSWIIGDVPAPPASATTISLPDLHPYLAPVAAVIPIQLFACYAAHLRGKDADSFRMDAPPYGEAFNLIRF